MLTITFLNQHSVALVCAVASASVFILLDLGEFPFRPLSPPLRPPYLEVGPHCG